MKKAVLLSIAFILFLSAVPDQEQPNFLLITIDTWRADYISASGSRRVQTPFIDTLAKEGSYIQKIDTPAPFTTPTHASILTGLYPENHGIRDNTHFRLKDDVRAMATLFKENGYKTIGVVSAAPLKKNYGLNKGFDIYDEEGIGVEGDGNMAPSSRDGRASAERALELARKSRDGRIFMWLHLYDPHYPYTPPPEFLRQYPRDPYAGEVAYVDKVLNDFVTGLLEAKKGKWIILLTGDHGEGLGEKDEMTHGFLLYKQTREVPLILWNSDKKKYSFGTGVKNVIDIFPTVIELFSLQQSRCDGISLSKNTEGTRWLFCETLYPPISFGLNPALLGRKDNDIYIEHGTSSEVYRGADEGKNLYETRKGFAAAAKAELKKFFGDGRIPPPNLKLKDEEIKSLKSLGYLGPSSGIPQNIGSCDLREFSKDFSSYFSEGNEDRKKGALGRALFNYDIMITKYPNSSILHFEKGLLLQEMKKFSDAKGEYRACLKLDPGNSAAMVNLGNILYNEGNLREAEKLYLSSLNCLEEQAGAHLNLVNYYLQDPDKKNLVIKHLKRFLEIAPNAPQRSQAEDMIKTLQNRD